MEHPTSLLDEDEYSTAISQGQKAFAQSAIVLLIVISIFGAALVLAAGVSRLQEPNVIELVISGMSVLRKIVPSERVMAILGVLATVGIAHAVSTRSLPSEVRNIQTTSTHDKTKLLDAVRRASRLQSALFASTLFSVLGAALSALVTILAAANSDIAAAAMSGLLSLFLFFELVRLFQATEDINEFKKSVSSKDRAAYRRAFTRSTGSNFKSALWYTLLFLALIVPVAIAATSGHAPMALKIAISTVITWSFGLSVSISYVRGTISVSLSSRLASRILGSFLFLVIWLLSAQVTLELMSRENEITWSLIRTYAASCLFVLGWCLLRIWGESGWLFFRNFAAQHSETILTAGSNSLAKLSWNKRPNGTLKFAFFIFVILAVPPIAFAVEQAPKGSALYPAVLFLISLIIASTARWSAPIERTANYILTFALIVLTVLRGLEDLGPGHHTIGVIFIAGGAMTALVSSALVWDRERRLIPVRPVLTMLDFGFARRFLQDSIELDNGNDEIPTSSSKRTSHLLTQSPTASK